MGENVDPPGSVEAGDQHVSIWKQLCVRGVVRRSLDRPHDLPGGAEVVDPAADLGHEHSAIGQRGVAVWLQQGPRRIVRAIAGGANGVDNVLATVQPQ